MKIQNNNINNLHYIMQGRMGLPDHVGPTFLILAVFKLRIMYHFGEIIWFSLDK